MKYTTLPNTDLKISRIGLGSLWIGGVDDVDAIATMHYGLEHGFTLIDTAEGYGRGDTEDLIARALEGRRDKAVIATNRTLSAKSQERIRT
jgi:aryl-alcohol dehydrogenase (NADP+)